MEKTGFVNYQDLLHTFEAFYAVESTAKKKPVILIFSTWKGIDDSTIDRAIFLSKLGYFAFAIDLYGKGIIPKNDAECAGMMNPYIENRQLIIDRTQKALAQIEDMPDADLKKMGAIGFCFGGLCALDMARRLPEIKGAVSFHGLLLPLPKIQKSSAKILVLHGFKDPMVSKEDLQNFEQEMVQSQIDFQITIFGEAYHSFTTPKANDPQKGTVYNEKISKRAFQQMINFFDEVFNE